MAKTKKNTFVLGNLPEEVADRSREVWLAGLGAIATAEEESSRFISDLEKEGDKLAKRTADLYNDLVERGRKLEAKGRKQLTAAVEDLTEKPQKVAKKAVKEATEAAEERVYDPVMKALKRFGVPTSEEIKHLVKKVETLATKVDALAVALETRQAETATIVEEMAEAQTVYTVTAREEGWAVMREGAERATSLHATKKEAVDAARDVAANNTPSLLVIYKQDGTPQEEVTYEA